MCSWSATRSACHPGPRDHLASQRSTRSPTTVAPVARWSSARPRGRRHAVHELSGIDRAGRDQRRQADEGQRLPLDQARGRRGPRRPGQAAGERGDPGDGPHRADTTELSPARRLQGPGFATRAAASACSPMPARSRMRACTRSCSRRFRPTSRTTSPLSSRPDDRDRRRRRLRRPGAGVL